MQNLEDGFDERVRDWLEPDQQTVERVKARVLSTPAEGRHFARAFVVAALAALVIGLGGFWFWRTPAPEADQLTATFDGDVLVIRAPDGRCSISGPPSGDSLPVGTWQITFQGERR
jgi:hypothetical protein